MIDLIAVQYHYVDAQVQLFEEIVRLSYGKRLGHLLADTRQAGGLILPKRI